MISSVLSPAAKKSRIRETHMRVPLMHGLPKHTFGSTDIRLNNGFIAIKIINVVFSCK